MSGAEESIAAWLGRQTALARELLAGQFVGTYRTYGRLVEIRRTSGGAMEWDGERLKPVETEWWLVPGAGTQKWSRGRRSHLRLAPEEKARLRAHEAEQKTARTRATAAAATLRRRRLSELHPDKLGRDQTPAERAEFTRLSQRRGSAS